MRVDARIVFAGTASRFLLLMVVLISSSISMLDVALGFFTGFGNGAEFSPCMLAAGADPNASLAESLPVIVNSRCHELHPTSTIPWKGIAGTLVVLSAAAVLYWWLPSRRHRRGRMVPLAAIDSRGEFAAELAGIAREMGIDSPPRYIVDPASMAATAVVFGRLRDYTMCLHGGLLATRASDPEKFRVIIRHELAHIRNRDVDLTYGLVALWRVFVIAALAPTLGIAAWWLFKAFYIHPDDAFRNTIVAMEVRSLLYSAFLVVLVHLARADILRHRELYADLDAADASGRFLTRWPEDPPAPTWPWAAKAITSITALVRTHPTWSERRRSLADPSPLFRVGALQVFLTGAAIPHLYAVLDKVLGLKHDSLAAWPIAGMITAIVGTAIIRSVVFTEATSTPPPSGLRSGLSMGLGMITGQLMAIFTGGRWLPEAPTLLLLLIPIGAVFSGWLAQCTRLRLRTWQGGKLSLKVLPLFLIAWSLLAVMLAWWNARGLPLTETGDLLIGPQMRHVVAQTFPGSWEQHTIELALLTFVVYLKTNSGVLPMIVATVVWVYPLLLWTRPAADGTAPAIRPAILAGLIGGVAGLLGITAAMAYIHSSQPPGVPVTRAHVTIYLSWLLAATAMGTAVAAGAMGALGRRYWLVRALVAAGIAQLILLLGQFLLTSIDGCLGPLNTLKSTCHWPPSAVWPLSQELAIDSPVFLCGSAMLAVLTAMATRLFSRWQTEFDQPILWGSRAGWGLAIVACVGSLISVLTGVSGAVPDSGVDRPVVTITPRAQGTPLPGVKRAQLAAWLQTGGLHQLEILTSDVGAINQALIKAAGVGPDAEGMVALDSDVFRPLCSTIADHASEAQKFLPIPDAGLQSKWAADLEKIKKYSADCGRAFDSTKNPELFTDAIGEIVSALEDLGQMARTMTEAKHSE
ncbi:M48 family metalloprotease [Sphaerimonospora cavernae]|uniref:M48 family metalloprotease n=1 Tax=Sphaerimonospora cavernae TaxID=1740611 RepID=A0ABV6UDE1_9ACTN